MDDVNTVPLYYENQIPELQITNDNLTEEIADTCDRGAFLLTHCSRWDTSCSPGARGPRCGG